MREAAGLVDPLRPASPPGEGSARPPPRERDPRHRWALAPVLVVGGGVVARLLVALGTDLYSDEAYYWCWSRHLALGYFDHPPLIAWLLAVLAPRPAALICGGLSLLAIYGFAADFHQSPRAGWFAAALWSAAPGAVFAGSLATPDAPLMLFWTLSLWAMHRRRWVLAGLSGGAGFLAKYTAALVWGAWALDGVSKRTKVGAAVGLAALVASPVLIWNAQHHWVSLLFQLHHGLGGPGGLGSLLEFVGGQLLMAGPVLLIWAVGWVARGPPEQRLLRLATGIPLALFAVAALRTRGEPNWPAMAYASACVGLSGKAGGAWRAAAFSGLALCLLGAAHLVHPLVRLERDTSLERLHGWRALSVLRQEDVAAAYAPTYHLASEVAYYARLPTGVFRPDRPSQFDLWPRPEVPAGGNALWISGEDEGPPPELAASFEQVQAQAPWESRFAGRTVHVFHVWKLMMRQKEIR